MVVGEPILVFSLSLRQVEHLDSFELVIFHNQSHIFAIAIFYSLILVYKMTYSTDP